VQSLKGQLHAVQQDAQSARQDAQNKAQTIDQLSTEISGLATNFAALQQAHATLSEDAVQLRKRLAIAEGEVASLNEKVSQAEEDYVSQADRTLAIEEELRKMTAENAGLLSQLEVGV
jgi:chromosome segregation ATPase